MERHHKNARIWTNCVLRLSGLPSAYLPTAHSIAGTLRSHDPLYKEFCRTFWNPRNAGERCSGASRRVWEEALERRERRDCLGLAPPQTPYGVTRATIRPELMRPPAGRILSACKLRERPTAIWHASETTLPPLTPGADLVLPAIRCKQPPGDRPTARADSPGRAVHIGSLRRLLARAAELHTLFTASRGVLTASGTRLHRTRQLSWR